MVKTYTIHGLECDDGAPLPAQEFVSKRDYDELESERDRLREACLQEHGGKYFEAECPICAALAGSQDEGGVKP